MLNPAKRLIIFDCDGVLVDSEPLASQALVDCLAKLGIRMSVDESIRRFKGRKMADCYREIESLSHRKLPENFDSTFRILMSRYFEKRLIPVRGVKQAIGALPNPKCVASNGPHAKMKRNLEITGLIEHFGENLFSAYTIQKWKPEPDLFLHACRTMGFQPDQSVVIEDSVSGIRAALAGGFRVLAYGEASLDHKNIVSFNEMSELPQLINAL